MAVTLVSPAISGIAGGTRVVVIGSGLTGATGVTFDGVPGTDFLFSSSGVVYVTAPAHAAGTVDVEVTVGKGVLVGGFEYRTDTFVHEITSGDTQNESPGGLGIGGATWFAAAVAWAATHSANGDSGSNALPAVGSGNAATLLTLQAELVDDGVIPPAATLIGRFTSYDYDVELTAGNTVQLIRGGSLPITITGDASGSLVSLPGTVSGTWQDFLDLHAQVFGPNFQRTNAAQAGGFGRLVVTNYKIIVTYQVAGSVDAISPDHGPTTGGTPVTITGSGFSGSPAPDVTFGGDAATNVVVVDDNTITCDTPAHAEGAVNVGVTNCATLVDGYTYETPDAVVDSVVPSTGTWEGGDSVTLYGSGFTGKTKAIFGAAEATDFVVVNDGEATCTTPPHGTGRGRVEVTVE